MKLTLLFLIFTTTYISAQEMETVVNAGPINLTPSLATSMIISSDSVVGNSNYVITTRLKKATKMDLKHTVHPPMKAISKTEYLKLHKDKTNFEEPNEN